MTRTRARTHTQHACVSVHENSHFNFGQAEAGMSFMHSLLELLHLVLLLLHSRFKLFLRLALPKMEKALKNKKDSRATGADINADLVVQGLLQHLNRVALLVHVLLCVSCVRWPNPLCVCVCVCVRAHTHTHTHTQGIGPTHTRHTQEHMDQQRHTIEVLQKALHDKVCVDVCTCRS